ncbi:MAG: hypothetical protein WD066_19810 [Planctomycetaceae bacterium]
MHDFVAERAVQVAADLRATAYSGIVALGERAGCDAFLVLDSGWPGIETLSLAARFRKPIYFSGSLGDDARRIRALDERMRRDGLTLMPEFGRRYTPSTSRLHELMATKLGRPRRIVLDVIVPRADDPCVPGQGPGLDFQIGLVDWCRYVVRTRPVRLSPGERPPGERAADGRAANDDAAAGRSLRLEFAQPRAGGDGCVVELRLRDGAAAGNGGAESAERSTFVPHVACERGEAKLLAPTEIEWRENGEIRRESLAAERSEVEVMLDHFCRRVVGGLVPIPDVDDVRRAVEIASAFDECLRSGREVPLSASTGRGAREA